MQITEGKTKLIKALVGFGGDITNPKLNKVNTHYNSKYATLDSILDHIRPVLAKHGLAIFQDTTTSEDNLYVGSKTIVFHESGEYMESSYIWLPAYKLLKGGAKAYDAQAAGIAATYSRRYSIMSTLSLSGDEDDDANGIKHEAQQQPAPRKQKETLLSKDQLNELVALLNEKRGEQSLNEFYASMQKHFKMNIPMDKLKPAGAKLIIDHLKSL